MVTATWLSGGNEVVVITEWNGPKEPASVFAARHRDAVDAKMLTHPVDH